MEGRDVFVSPVISRDIGEEVVALVLNAAGIHTCQFVDEGTLAMDDVIQFGHIFAQVLNFLGHGHARRGDMVALAELEADTGR